MMTHPFDEGLDNKEARKLWRQNGGLWESTKDNARAGWQATKDAVGKGANFAGEQAKKHFGPAVNDAKKVANVVKNPIVNNVPGMLKRTPHAAVVLEGVNSLGSAYDRVNNSGLDAAPDVGEASAIAGLSNMIYGSPDKIRGLFTGEKDDRFDRGANEFSQAIADRFIDVASFFGADDPRENIKQNAFVPGKVDKSVAQTTTPAEPTKKKGLTQAQMKSRIEASAYANDDPNKWGLNGKMPQGWGVVKKSNGEVVVTPPSESNFWGDPEAEKAWRAAEANRKMGLWSMEKTMDPTASLKERQLAADIYDMRLRQQAAAVQKGLDPRAQALAEQRMHEGYVNQGRSRLEGMFNNLAQMEPDEAKRAQLLYNMNSTLGRDRRLWMKNGQPIMNLTDLDERIPLIADYMRALYENWKATGVWETDLSRIKGDHTLTDRFWQLFSNVPQTPHGITLDGSYTQIPMVENRRVNNLIRNTQEYNDKRGLRE
jgi:hypothetical protein